MAQTSQVAFKVAIVGELGRVARHMAQGGLQRELDALGERPPTVLRPLRLSPKKFAQRQHTLPTGEHVVGHINHPARREPLVNEIDELPAIVRRDPTPHAVQANEIEGRQIRAGAPLGEARRGDLQPIGQAAGERAHPLDVRWQQVVAPPMRPARHRVDGEVDAATKAEFAGARDRGGGMAEFAEAPHHERRIEARVIARRVGQFGDIAGGAFAHSPDASTAPQRPALTPGRHARSGRLQAYDPTS